MRACVRASARASLRACRLSWCLFVLGYLKHADCYAKQDASVRCVKKFSSDVTDVLAMDTDDADESTEKMCR